MRFKNQNPRKQKNKNYQNNRNLGFTGQYQWPQPSQHYYPQDNDYTHGSHQEHEDNFSDYRVRHPESFSYQFDRERADRFREDQLQEENLALHKSSWSPERNGHSGPEYSPVQQSVNPGFQSDSRSSSQFRKSFIGRGPKGYRRSDERIKEDVSYALTQSSEVDATEIEVDVQEGVVILSGSVHDRAMKRAAEDCAETVLGVDDIRNQLRVTPVGDAPQPVKST